MVTGRRSISWSRTRRDEKSLSAKDLLAIHEPMAEDDDNDAEDSDFLCTQFMCWFALAGSAIHYS